MERSGLSFARFVRALRMGLGNRHEDPKVQAGLDLFRGKFRKSSMADMLEIAKKLREIFGWECGLLDSFSQDECLRGDPSDLDAHGEGITNQEVQSEIQRINNPRKSPGKAGEGKGGTRWINVSEEEQFETISTVTPMAFDRNQHAPYAQKVARPARQLRQYLKDLGLSMVQHRMRVAGRMLDKTRIRAVVLRNDPRMLIARQRKTHNDLFLGAIIDCSGSMDYGGNIEKAKMFGALLAEAVNGLDGVDLRLFGFTDAVIYDAGNEQRPAVHALHAGGGNNDAAALWHAAQVAMASRRKAKVLVMISDGLPTECSAKALRGLATRLTNRQKICCAQVAVQPLEEICFPHYILLDEADVGTSVRRFGNTIARLVRRAMSSG
jgi:Mg-chelatase subunit ChlD